jgi:hypothetical protein
MAGCAFSLSFSVRVGAALGPDTEGGREAIGRRAVLPGRKNHKITNTRTRALKGFQIAPYSTISAPKNPSVCSVNPVVHFIRALVPSWFFVYQLSDTKT